MPNEPHQNDTHPCPPHHHRCHATFQGYIDCPTTHAKFKTVMLNIPCGAQNPNAQITTFLGLPANTGAEVVQVLDLAHDGWLAIFSVPI